MRCHNVDNERIELEDRNAKHICIKNCSGVLHKINNVKELIKEGKKIIKNQRPEYIICDAFSFSPSIATLRLSKKYKIPAVAIVTDLHEASCNGSISTLGKIHSKLMKKFDNYYCSNSNYVSIVQFRALDVFYPYFISLLFFMLRGDLLSSTAYTSAYTSAYLVVSYLISKLFNKVTIVSE